MDLMFERTSEKFANNPWKPEWRGAATSRVKVVLFESRVNGFRNGTTSVVHLERNKSEGIPPLREPAVYRELHEELCRFRSKESELCQTLLKTRRKYFARTPPCFPAVKWPLLP